MKTHTLTFPSNPSATTTLIVGSGMLNKVTELFGIENYTKVCVVTDTNVAPRLLDTLLSALPASTVSVVVPAGEKHKDLQSLEIIWKAMADGKLDRKSVVITLGGGLISDIGGFAASTYMRGVDVIHIPTTLLAQTDASIGGKTGIDLDGIKNVVGTFHQPVGVLIDVDTLATLPKRELQSGFAEIVKHGLIADSTLVDMLEAKKKASYTQNELIEIISRSCLLKARVVTNDTRESGMRKILNFGHTIGHAIESESLQTPEPLLHGEAIAIGIAAETHLSQLMGLLSSQTVERIIQLLRKLELPTSRPSISYEQLIDSMRRDKKNTGDTMTFVLLKNIGEATICTDVPTPLVRQAIDAIAHNTL